MQSVEFVMRQIGNPSPDGMVISGKDTKEYLEYQYLSKGYNLKSEHYLGPVMDDKGAPSGFRFMFILVKEEGQAVQGKADAKK